MNITNGIENLSRTLEVRPSTAEVPGRNGSAAPETGLIQDEAHLSNVGTQVAQSASASDVRLDKVAAIRSALEAGTYQVPASAVAEKVITSMIEEGK